MKRQGNSCRIERKYLSLCRFWCTYMADSPRKVIDSLHTHVTELITRHEALRERCEKLESRLRERNNTVEELKKKLEGIESKYRNLLMAQAVVSEKGDFSEARSRFEKLVREIDKCISLLND